MPKLPTFRSSSPSSSSPRSSSGDALRPEVGVVAIIGVALVAVIAVSLFRSGDSFDRNAAVLRVVDESAGRITVPQAECYVDRVHHELGGKYLAADAEPPKDIIIRMTSVRIDCVGVANLAQPTTTVAAGSDPGVPSTEAGNLPRELGADPVLDKLVGQCADGVGQACDDLFELAPVGSDYESFAVTCGNRTREQRCATVYTAPAPTDPPPTSAPPASAPPS